MADDAVVSIEHLSKTYKVGRRIGLVPVPMLLGNGYRDLSADRDRSVEEDIDDDDEVDEIDEGEQDLEREDTGPVREIVALDDVTFEVPRGASVALIGPNGGGKSTLLKVLARITPPTAGRVVVRGRVAPMFETAAGFMHPESTGPENVRLLGRLLDVPRGLVESRTAEILAFAQLEGMEKAQLKRYSSGMARRLAFSVALHLDPDLLLADGVLGVGDKDFRALCMERIQEHRARGLALLFASHDLDEVRRLCTHAAWLDAGCLHAFGEVEAIVAALQARAAAAKRQARIESKQRSEHGVIGEVRLLSPRGDEVTALPPDEPARLEVDLEVWQDAAVSMTWKLVPDLGPPYKMLSPQDWSLPGPVSATASAELAPGSLRGGRYRAEVGLFLTVDGRRSKLSKMDALSFDVDEGPDEDPPPSGEKRILLGARDWRLRT